MTRAWNWRQVLWHEKTQEITRIIEDLSGADPGTDEFMKFYQKGVTQYAEEYVDKEDKAQLVKKAAEWTEKAPPEEVQRRYGDDRESSDWAHNYHWHSVATKKGRRYMREFAEEMFQQAGMRVFIMAAYVDIDGKMTTEQ